MSALQVTALARWYHCPDCEVSWFDATPVCWSCDVDRSVLSHAPHMKDSARTTPDDLHRAVADGLAS